MYQRLILPLLWVLLWLFAGAASAETVYVNDYLRVGVRANPNSSESPVEVVATGDALTVLGREGDYIKVRTGEGTEGWVSKNYVSADMPARLQLEQLKKSYARNEARINDLRKELNGSAERNEALEKQIEELTAMNESLQQELSDYTSTAARLKRKYAWVYQSAIVIVLFLLGFSLGIRWYKRQVTVKLGGLEI